MTQCPQLPPRQTRTAHLDEPCTMRRGNTTMSVCSCHMWLDTHRRGWVDRVFDVHDIMVHW